MAVADLKSTFQNALSTTAQQISQSVSSNAQQISQSVSSNAQQISQSVNSNAQQISQSVDRFMKVGSIAPCSNHYRNNAVINNWRGISEVAFAIYKNHKKVKQVIFDGSGSTYMNWFHKNRVKDSSWLDLKTSGSNHFSLVGHQEGQFRRTMFMNVRYGGCPNDVGWFVAIDNTHGYCPWEHNLALPVFKYSYTDTASNWNSATTTADYIAIFVRYFNVPSSSSSSHGIRGHNDIKWTRAWEPNKRITNYYTCPNGY
ncbi:uncharacterized protein LOC131947798 [Physella acuta]|uniref:uncharacterized protein LOC131947798 n=1 Tax=Physella acuta TaxID=109671 RepID=UPI0027DBF8B1|nr:uncharacterized protein LOC131947798 [Physella acuta]